MEWMAMSKVWLQLVFPLYIILIVAIVIIICEHSPQFSRLLSNRNPVATLATLILLSYTKLLCTIIAAFSFTRLEYPDGSLETVWLFDTNIPYLQGKHIALSIAAFLVLLLGLLYTLLLFFTQLANSEKSLSFSPILWERRKKSKPKKSQLQKRASAFLYTTS